MEKVTMDTRCVTFGKLSKIAEDVGVVHANGDDFVVLEESHAAYYHGKPAFTSTAVRIGEVVKNLGGDKLISVYEVWWSARGNISGDPIKDWGLVKDWTHPDVVHCTDSLIKVK